MTELDRIKQPIVEELSRYAQLFDSVLTHEEDFMRRVLDYVRGRKGKMMRPILVLLLAKELGEIGEPTLRAAVALELLHTSSLIHDDVVDESEERRGKASVRKVYDNKVAVLLGDYMLAQTLRQSALTGHIGIVDAVAAWAARWPREKFYNSRTLNKKVSQKKRISASFIAKPVLFSRPAVNLRRFQCMLTRISSVVRAN